MAQRAKDLGARIWATFTTIGDSILAIAAIEANRAAAFLKFA
jgi:hypothetical protein